MWWVELLNSFVSVLDSGGAGGGAGAYESIATVNGTGSASSVTFSSIPSTYKHLQVRWLWRSTAAATTSAAGVRLNGDSGGNYATHRLLGDGSGVSAQGSTAQTYAGGPLSIASDSATANCFTVGILDIEDYTSTTKNKTMRFSFGHDFNGSGVVFLSSSLWLNTNAVTSLTLLMADSARNISSTSVFSLYGIKGA